MPLVIRLLRDSEYLTAIDFYNNTPNLNGPAQKIKRGLTEFNWEFFDGPDRQAVYACAWDVEEEENPVLVGTQCMIIHKMISTSGKIILAAKGEDTLIETAALTRFRKDDILKKLNTLLTATCESLGVEFLWGFNRLPATFKRLGYEIPFKSFNTVMVLNPVKTYRYLVKLRSEYSFWRKLKIEGLSFLSYVYSLKRIFVTSKKNHFQLNTCTNDNTELIKNASENEKLLFLIQNEEYFEWRINNNPYNVKYKVIQLMDDDKTLKGQIVFSINNGTAYIEQTLISKDLKRRNINFLLKNAINLLKNEAVFLIRYTGTLNNALNAREVDLMRSIGFVKTGTGEFFTFKKLTGNPSISPENIYLSHLYKQGRF